MKKVVLTFVIIFCLFSQQMYSQAPDKAIGPWNDPVLFQGSDFGGFFQQLYMQGNWDEMIKFTSKKNIEKYGIDSIKNYYQSIDFSYDMELKSKSVDTTLHITTLNYQATILGQKKTTRLNIIVESDTCRLLLDNTVFHLGITWGLVEINNFKK